MSRLPSSTNARVDGASSFSVEFDNADSYTVQWFRVSLFFKKYIYIYKENELKFEFQGAEKIENNDRTKSVKTGNTFRLDIKVRKISQELLLVRNLRSDAI